MSSSITPDAFAELRSIAERLAGSAGRLALDGRRRATTMRSVTKSTASDLVTEFDAAAERQIVEWLRANRPDDAIVGEEGTSVPGTSGFEWHIDPIDGTTNFVYDQPAWACSVGVRHGAQTVAGAVYVPVLDEMFSAEFGAGATLNGAPIQVNRIEDLSLALVATGFSFQSARRTEQGRVVAELLGQVRDIRRLGSAAIDLCFVACGRADVYFERGLNSWDMLAGELIATEAGATASNFSGGALTPAEVLVAAPGVHTAMIALLSDQH